MATVPVPSMPLIPTSWDELYQRIFNQVRMRIDSLRMFNRTLAGDLVVQMPPLGSRSTDLFNSDRATARVDGSNALVGSVELSLRNVTSVARLQATDCALYCDATAAAFAVYLPAANLAVGRIYCIKKTDATANAVTITANGTDVIDGAATKALAAQWNCRILQSNGVTGWYIIATI